MKMRKIASSCRLRAALLPRAVPVLRAARFLRATLFLGVAAGALAAPAHAADIPALVAAAKPSIVAIGTFSRLQNPQFRFLGSGFAAGNGRQVVTSAHVIPTLDPALNEVIAVAIPEGTNTRVYEAKPQTIDRDSDLAVLEMSGPALPPLAIAPAGEAREGAEVVLMGYPIGSALGLFPAVHRGVIAAVTPMINPSPRAASLKANQIQVMRGDPITLLQLDATTFPGNSGGPVIDSATGRVVGVVNLGIAKGNRESAIQFPTGISYAVPVRYLLPMLTAR